MSDYQQIEFAVSGLSPLMMHNGQLADPLNEWAKRLKEISSKRKKSDADHMEMSHVEFLGGLYVDDKQRPVIPGVNIEAMLLAAAKKNRLGEAFKAGIISEGLWPLEYDGPKTGEELWKQKRYISRLGVKLNGKVTVFRTRPIFKKWQLTFVVHFLSDMLNPEQVIEAVRVAGRIIGLGDYKPKHGRFEITNHRLLKAA